MSQFIPFALDDATHGHRVPCNPEGDDDLMSNPRYIGCMDGASWDLMEQQM